MIRQFRDYDGDIRERCDVCVIGSGAGGAVVAKELAEKGFSVVLLEEGGHHTKETWNGKPTQGLIDMYRDGGSSGTLGNPFISITLGKCIGGTTTVNSATCFRTPNKVLLRWQMELGLDRMTRANLEPYFDRVEKIINVTELPWEVLGNGVRAIKRGADRLGLNCRPLKHNVRNCHGCGTCQFGCPEGAKQSMDVTYIPRADRAGARIYAHCRAEKLVIDSRKVRGVRGSIIDPSTGRKKFSFEIDAHAVVVSCGSLITPSFLKANGLKNRNIGRHLQIHPAGRVVALMNEKIEGWKGVSQGACIDNFEDEGIMMEGIFVHPSLMLAGLPGVGARHKEVAVKYPNIAAFGVMIHDSTAGRVYRIAKGRGFIATYAIRKNDMEKFKRGIAYTARIFFAGGALRVFTPFANMPVLDSMEDVEKLLKLKVKPNQMEMMAFHPLGTCRMARSPKLGAVKGDGESFEVKNLYVADGSIVPTSLGVNPQVTIMTLATLVAENISNKLFDETHLA
ncbi:MAG TPA: GMC family oxidoreductase [Spirochaetota bacterium]|nr:GMC family oxidoreductase [Spirochaetota bacterium]